MNDKSTLTIILDPDGIRKQALEELEQEEYKRLVEEEKERIIEARNKPKHWFPWRIRIINLNKGGQDGYK